MIEQLLITDWCSFIADDTVQKRKKLKLMVEKTVTLSKDQMHAIARYDITFQDLSGDLPVDQCTFACTTYYNETLDDLYHLLIHLRDQNPLVTSFRNNWYTPIMALKNFFMLNPDDYERADDSLPRFDTDYPGLRVSDNAYFNDIWNEIENACVFYTDSSRMSETIRFDYWIPALEQYFSNKGKPITDWDFPEEDKISFIRELQGSFLEKATDDALELGRRLTDELCHKNNPAALRLKGFACYSGNRLFPQNSELSYSCFRQLFDQNEDPSVTYDLVNLCCNPEFHHNGPDYSQAPHGTLLSRHNCQSIHDPYTFHQEAFHLQVYRSLQKEDQYSDAASLQASRLFLTMQCI